MAGPTTWFFDYVTPDLIQLFSLRKVLYSGRSRYQSIQVIETASYGRCLVLDGKIQCSEADEFIYHEALVHSPLLCHPHPESVFVAGGGEGATIREALAHSTVKRVVMVDIDKKVVEVSKKFLPFLHGGSFSDGRVELRFEDAKRFLVKTKDRFDIVLIDLPEPIEEGPAYLLYTREFYEMVRERLTERGIVCVQAGSTSLENPLNFLAVNNTLRAAFPEVYPYQVSVPSFGGAWGFALASKSPGQSPLSLSPQEVDRRIGSRISRPLRLYDGLAHQGLFSLPKYLREELEREKRIITDREPLFIY